MVSLSKIDWFTWNKNHTHSCSIVYLHSDMISDPNKPLIFINQAFCCLVPQIWTCTWIYVLHARVGWTEDRVRRTRSFVQPMSAWSTYIHVWVHICFIIWPYILTFWKMSVETCLWPLTYFHWGRSQQDGRYGPGWN